MFFRSLNRPIMEMVKEEPRTTAEIAAKFNIPTNDRQKLYTRLSQLRSCGLIELKYIRPTREDHQQVTFERERSASTSQGGRPKGRLEWWKWALTFRGEQALEERANETVSG